MAPSKRPWLRLYTETAWDLKIRALSLEARWTWIAVLILARQSPTPGALIVSNGKPVVLSQVADCANRPEKNVRSAIAELVDADLLSLDPILDAWVVPKWGDRQFESDDSTARSTKQRRYARVATPDASLMQRPNGVDATPDATDQRTETEAETEAEEPLAPVGAKRTDVVWDALMAVTGVTAVTSSARGAYNRATKDLRDVGAEPDEIARRGLVFRERWPDASLTPTALARRWGECDPDRQHAPVDPTQAMLRRLGA
jgi:hypothetical protein